MSEWVFHVIVLLGITIAASVEAIIDEIVSRRRSIEHGLSATIRTLVISLINVIAFKELWYAGMHSVIGLGWYWFIFSGVWGYRRLKDFWYIGTTAVLDKLNRATTGTGAGGVIMFRLFVTLFFVGIFWGLSFF
jgi:hypothetical protein